VTEQDEQQRTTGHLPVRQHLKPQPTQRDWTWFYHRMASGRFDVVFLPTEDADEWEIVGEA
jgi:hypothetical protein